MQLETIAKQVLEAAMTTLVDEDDAFLAVARQALSSTDASTVLDSLGWGELLGDLDDLETRRAAFTLFRAQGRELANSPALGRLMACECGGGDEPGRRGDPSTLTSTGPGSCGAR